MNESTVQRRPAGGRLSFHLMCGGISHLLSAAVTLFLTPVLLTRLGVELYGYYRTALETAAFVGLCSGLLGSTVARYVSIEHAASRRESCRNYFSSVFWGQLGLLGVLLVPAVLYVIFCGELLDIPTALVPSVRLLFSLVLSAAFIDAGTGVFGAVYTASGRLDFRAAQELAAILIKASLLWLFFGVGLCDTAVGLGIAILSASVLGGGLRIFLTGWLMPLLRPRLCHFRFSYLRRVAASGIWYSVYEFSGWLGTGALLPLAGFLFGAEQAGVFSVALTATHFFGGLIAMLAGLRLPPMTRQFASGAHGKLTDEIIGGEKLVGFFTLVGVSVTVGFLPEFFGFWSGVVNTPELRLMTVLMLVPCLSASGALPIFQLAVVMNRLWRLSLLYFGGALLGLAGAIGLCLFTDLGLLGLGIASFVSRVIWGAVVMPFLAGRLMGGGSLRFYMPVVRTYLGALISVLGIWLFKRFCVIGSVFSLAVVAFVCSFAVTAVGYFCIYGKRIPKFY